MTVYALLLPVSITLCLFAFVCLVLSIRDVLRFGETRRVSLIEAVAMIGTVIVFVIFANFTIKGYIDIMEKKDKSPEFYFLDYGDKK